MKLAKRAYIVTLMMLVLVFTVSAQDRSEKDPRNTAPTVGTGGAVGGPTGLFTVYDGQTLRKGEYTLSIAYSNYDRDPGNVDITSVPLSFQVGLSNKFELFFGTEAFRGVKVNAPRNLSGFYLPNSQVRIGAGFRSAPAIILAPGNGNRAIFRPTGLAPFVQFPFSGGNAGTFGLQFPFFSGPQFGFPAGTNALLGPPRAGGGGADLFPGIGSVFGGILPGVVFSTTTLVNNLGQPSGEGPVAFTTAPTYIADAPFINRRYGTSSFNSFDIGFKYRFNNVTSPIGYGISAFYRWYPDTADDFSGFNQLQRGAGPGGGKGDFGATIFADARLAKWVNMSANVGYTYTSQAKGTFGGTDFVILDRPDEFNAALGLDFPVNNHFQPILEIRGTRYVGGRTPNALERNPLDGLAGVRIFPRRWFGLSFAYRYNFNEQDRDSFDSRSRTSSIVVGCQPTPCTPVTINNTFAGAPTGFVTSSDPHGYIAQFFIGRRDKRQAEVENKPASVDSVTLGGTVITLPCGPGQLSRSGACSDNKTISVATRASDPENDVLTYNYTVSGGRVIGTGANVQWDLSTAQTGTYTITTGVDDGCGVCGKTDTKTITVQNCPDCYTPVECACPTAPSVSGPSGVTSPGSTMTFTASSSGDVSYNWTVSAGTIESGQGTPSITVRTSEADAGGNITATVTISGDAIKPNCNCVTTASETAGVAAKPTSNLTDEFPAATDDDIKARVDNFYIQLNNNPSARGFIINYGTPAQIKKRRASIMKAINFRKYDVSRITFVDGPDNGAGVNTKFYLVPAGATDPTP